MATRVAIMTKWRVALGNALIRFGSRLTGIASKAESPIASQTVDQSPVRTMQPPNWAGNFLGTVRSESATNASTLSVDPNPDLAHEQVRQLIKR